MKHGIKKKFYKGEHPVALNVGELKKIIKELPDDLAIKTTWADGVALVVFNIDEDGSNPCMDERHLSFQSTEDY